MPSYHGTCWKLWEILLAALGSHSLYNSLQLSALGQPPTEFVYDRAVHKEQIPEFTNDDPTGLISPGMLITFRLHGVVVSGTSLGTVRPAPEGGQSPF